MNYADLGDLLEKLGRKIARSANKMQGETMARDAVKLRDVAVKFDAKLKEVVAGAVPGMAQLEDLLKGPQAKKYLDLKACNKISRELKSGRLDADKPAAARRDLLKAIKAASAEDDTLAETALELVRTIFSEGAAAAEGPAPKDKIELQNELLRLGELSDEDFVAEFKARYRTQGSIRALAQANAIAVKRGDDWIAKETLIKHLKDRARRAAENVRHRATD